MKKFILFLLFLAGGLLLLGQQPDNDMCANAQIITVADGNCQLISYNNAGWTSDGISTTGQNCAAETQYDIWFKFTAPTSGSVVIRFGSIPDTEMSLTIRSGNCNQNAIAVFCSVFNENYTFFIEGLTSGNVYYIRISDENPSTTGDIQMCISKCEISVTGQVTDVSCHNGNDGEIDLTVEGGTGSLNYDWEDLTGTNNVEDRTDLIARTYSVTVTDDAGCEATRSWTVVQPEELSATVTKTNVTCYGANDGKITISSASGGYGTYEYSKDGGTSWQQSGSYNNLPNATYDVRIRDKDHTTCVVDLDGTTGTIITQPALITATVSSANPTDCNTSNGIITISNTTGGNNIGYDYKLNNGAWQASNQFNLLAAETYNVWVRNSALPYCETQIGTVTLISPSSPTATINNTNPNNCGTLSGSIQIDGSGGTGSYDYSKDNGQNWIQGQPDPYTFTELSAGTYNLKIRYADNTCETSLIAQLLIDPPSPVITNVNVDNITNCGAKGKVTINSSIQSGYSQQFALTLTGNSDVWQNSNIFENLSVGNYIPKARNMSAVNCIDTENAVILSEPPTPVISQAAITQPITQCGGTGQITITSSIQSGSSQQFALTPVGNSNDTWVSSNVFTVQAGTYIPKARNAAAIGCIDEHTNILIDNPPLPEAFSISKAESQCIGNDVPVTIPAVNYNRQLVYDLTGSNKFSNLIVEVSSGVSVFIIPKDKLTTSGNTTITITSIKNTQTNCINFNLVPAITKEFQIFSLPIAQISVPTDKVCKNSLPLLVYGDPSGGSGIWTQHVWTGNGAQYLTNTGVEYPKFYTNSAGTYSLYYQVKDNNNCMSVLSPPKTITIHPLPVANPFPTVSEVCEKSGLISLDGNPSEGTSPYSHLWKGLGDVKLDNKQSQTPKFNPDYPGAYTLKYIVTDKNGCKDTSDVVNIKVNPKPEAKYEIEDLNGHKIDDNNLLIGIGYKYRDKSSYFIEFNNLKWTFSGNAEPNVITSDQNEVINFWNKLGNATVNLEVSNIKNCKDTISNTYSIKEGPFANINIGCGNNYSTCKGSEICFNSQGSLPRQGFEISEREWKLDGVIVSTSEEFIYVFSEPRTYKMSLRVKDYNSTLGFKWSEEEVLSLTINDSKNNGTINDFSICQNEGIINLLNIATGSDKQFIQFKEAVGIDVLAKTFDPKKIEFNNTDSKEISVDYTVQDGNCIGKIDTFVITVYKTDPINIQVLNSDTTFCFGDTLFLKSTSDWIWNPNGMSLIKNNNDEAKFLLNSKNPKILVSDTLKYQNKTCIVKDEKNFLVNSNPIIPSLYLPDICKGSDTTLLISLNENEFIEWDQSEFIDTVILNSKYRFYPLESSNFPFTITNNVTTCTSDSILNIKITKVEPIIIPLDSCGNNIGSIFAIKPGSVSNPGNIKWSLKEQSKGNITEGQGTKAIIVGWNDNSLSEIKVQVSEGICTGEGTIIPNSSQKSLPKRDTSLVFKRCGSIIFNKDTSCAEYYLGYVDHGTGQYVRVNSSKHYYVDTSRVESSERTYFINCSDCSGTDIITYREIENNFGKPCDEQIDAKIFVVPNPSSGDFELFYEGDYKGVLHYEIFNTFGQRIIQGNFTKNNYLEKLKLRIDSNAGIYYLRLFDSNNRVSIKPIVVTQ